MRIGLPMLFLCLSGFTFCQSNYQKYMANASALIIEGKHEQAKAILTKAINEYPDSSECYVQLGGNYYFTGELNLALITFNEAIRLDSSKMESYKYRGMILHRQKKQELAQRDYEKYHAFNPNDSLIMLKSATCLFDQNKLVVAKSKLEKFHTTNSEFVEAYFTLGAIHEIQRNLDESIKYYGKAISLDTSNYLGYYYRARIYYTQGKYESGCEDMFNCVNNGGYLYLHLFDDFDCFKLLGRYPNPPPMLMNEEE